VENKSVSIACVLALVVGIVAAPQSSASVKAGATCKKAGFQSVSSGRTFTCIKQGKKLVWNKGVVVKARPAANPSPSAAPAPVASPSPAPTFTPPARPTSWADLVSKSEGITYWAWKLAQERVAQAGAASTEFVIHIGPNTEMNVKDPEKILKMVSAFYSQAPQVKKTHVVFFDFQDIKWAQEIDKKYSSLPRTETVAFTCQSRTLCNGGNAYIDSNLVAFNYVASSPTNRSIAMKNKGETIAHEYFHAIQLLPNYDVMYRGNEPKWSPDWIREGTAEWFATNVLSEDFDFLVNYQRNFSEIDLYRSKLSAETIGKVLTVNNGQSDNGFYQYNVGAKVAEALVVLKGVDSILEFDRLGAQGQTFENAFQTIYGISWAEAKPILVEAISKYYK
jgi:hypothetical protein